VIVAGWALFPLAWIVTSSLKPQLITPNPEFLPTHPTFRYYERVVRYTPFFVQLMNSISTAVGATAVAVLVGSLAAYVLSRLYYGRETKTTRMIIVVYMFPTILLAIPYYVLAATINMLDQLAFLTFTYSTMNLAFVIWMLKAFFDTIPIELDEAATIEGANTFQIFFKVILPLAAPGLVAAAIFVFMASWNEFLLPLLLTSSDLKRTLPVALYSYMGQELLQIGELLAAATMMTIPEAVFAYFVQKWLVTGLTAGAVKG
jgi:multiple sugar transport system permease protein